VYEYKIVTERDKRLAGGFYAAALEDTLNGYAADGWRLADSVFAANIMKSAKVEVLFILERSIAA